MSTDYPTSLQLERALRGHAFDLEATAWLQQLDQLPTAPRLLVQPTHALRDFAHLLEPDPRQPDHRAFHVEQDALAEVRAVAARALADQP